MVACIHRQKPARGHDYDLKARRATCVEAHPILGGSLPNPRPLTHHSKRPHQLEDVVISLLQKRPHSTLPGYCSLDLGKRIP